MFQLTFFFLSFIKRFQTALTKHIAVEVCVVLPKFKLTLLQIEPPSVSDDEPGREQTVAQAADGADLCDTSGLEKDCGRRDLAYVLHTSGTTGLPKIVKVPHKCILPNILHLRLVIVLFASFLLRYILSSESQTVVGIFLWSDLCFRSDQMMWFSWPPL